MIIIFIDTYYQNFLKTLRNQNNKLSIKSYTSQKKFLLSQGFGTSNFFSSNFRKLGWNAKDLIINDAVLQKKWAKENGLKLKDNPLISKIQMLPYAYRFFGKPSWIQDIALAQIEEYKPDIVYMQDLSVLNPGTLQTVKTKCKLLVGQIASPLPPEKNIKHFDLIITSFPHYVKIFKKMGIKSVYHKLAFEPGMLKKVGKLEKKFDVTFIGSFSPHHSEGTKVLEDVSQEIPINVWGHGVEYLSPNSPLRKNYHGEAWGNEMYEILAQSKIVINRHIKVANGNANNMRLYEATGMGAMLITDHKKNLNDLFKVGTEVVTYKSKNELIKKIKYYLAHGKEREKIAAAGQKKTLSEHHYPKRMRELSDIIKENMKQ